MTVFSRQIVLDEDPAGAVVVSTNFVDDGAVYYLNGERVGGLRMPKP
jgi:hypothetical protein